MKNKMKLYNRADRRRLGWRGRRKYRTVYRAPRAIPSTQPWRSSDRPEPVLTPRQRKALVRAMKYAVIEQEDK